jgi:hypothetical protein
VDPGSSWRDAKDRHASHGRVALAFRRVNGMGEGLRHGARRRAIHLGSRMLKGNIVKRRRQGRDVPARARPARRMAPGRCPPAGPGGRVISPGRARSGWLELVLLPAGVRVIIARSCRRARRSLYWKGALAPPADIIMEVRIPGVTAHPAGAWTARQARSLLMDPGERAGSFRFLTRDRDGKFTTAFDEASCDNGTRVVKTPARAPRASSHAERFAGTLRRECLDHVLVLGERHLRGILAEYARHYDGHRPHQSLRQEPPLREPGHAVDITARIERRQVLGGLISEYHKAA